MLMAVPISLPGVAADLFRIVPVFKLEALNPLDYRPNEAAFVGLSVEQAKAKGIDAVEVKMPMSIDAKAMITNEIHGMIKIVADKASQRVVGVHYLADHADTLIGEGVMMVSGRMTLEQVANAIHPHPTQTEMFGEMARRLLSRLRRTRKK